MNRDPRLHFPNRSPRAAAMAAARRALRGAAAGTRVDSEIAIDATVRGVLRTFDQFDRLLKKCASEECAAAVREAIARGELAPIHEREGTQTNTQSQTKPGRGAGLRHGLGDDGARGGDSTQAEPPPVLRFIAGPVPATIPGSPL